MKTFKLKTLVSIVLVFAMMLFTVSCGPATSVAPETAAPDQSDEAQQGDAEVKETAKSGRKFALVVLTTESVFMQFMNKGAQAEAEKNGDTMFFTSAVKGVTDVNGQVDVMEDCINQGYDGILLSASDMDALKPVTERAIEAGIPVVTVDNGVNSDKVSCAINTNNRGGAEILAEQCAQQIGGKGKVAILSFQAGVVTGVEREEGFRDYMAEHYPEIECLETQYYGNDTQKGLEITQNILTAHPDLAAVYSTNEYGAVGAGRALTEISNDTCKVYTFDCSTDLIRLVEDGILRGLMVLDVAGMGALGVEKLNATLDGETVEKNIVMDCVLVTPENIKNPEIQKILWF